MTSLDKLWSEKWRPKSLDECIFQDTTHKKAFAKMVATRSIPHLLLSGTPGSGKTTIARILIQEMSIEETDVMTINASEENSVDTIRDKIKAFITTFAFGPFKIVHMQEADYITPNGQAVLRVMMEEFSDVVRFILTCNHENKIIPAIKSRCQHYRFQAFDKNDIAEKIATILAVEKVKFDLDLVDKYVVLGYPDIRKITNLVQQNSIGGTLLSPTSGGEVGDYKFELIGCIEQDNWQAARKVVCASVVPEEWEFVYRFLYENLDKSNKFSDKDKWEAGIVVIAEHLYKNSLVADQEINAAAMFIRLSQL